MSDSLDRFRPIGWYGAFGLGLYLTRRQKVLRALRYYELRWWLGWGKKWKWYDSEADIEADEMIRKEFEDEE
jgi:hypothetical protein